MAKRTFRMTSIHTRTKSTLLAGAAILALSGTAIAQSWQPADLERLAMTAEIPADMVSSGGSANSRHYTDPHGNRVTFTHLNFPDGEFSEVMADVIEDQKSNGNWSIGGQTIAPDWAEWWAADGERQVRERYVPTCHGTAVNVVRLDYWLPNEIDAMRLVTSLAAMGDGCR